MKLLMVILIKLRLATSAELRILAKWLAAMMAVKRLDGVAPELNLKEGVYTFYNTSRSCIIVVFKELCPHLFLKRENTVRK